MTNIVKEIQSKYGDTAGEDVARLLQDLVRRPLLAQLENMQEYLKIALLTYQPADTRSASELQKRPFGELERCLAEAGKIMILYKSKASAVMFDIEKLEEIRENIEARLTLIGREQLSEGTVSAEEFDKALTAARPEE
jgi:hypothetical protein